MHVQVLICLRPDHVSSPRKPTQGGVRTSESRAFPYELDFWLTPHIRSGPPFTV